LPSRPHAPRIRGLARAGDKRSRALGRLAVGAAAIAVGFGAGARVRRPLARGAIGLVLLDVACNAPTARDIVVNALDVAEQRARNQRGLVLARLGRSLGRAHQPLSRVRDDLRSVLELSPAADSAAPTAIALERLERIGALLRDSRFLREELGDDRGNLPLFGGHAARITRDRESPLTYGSGASLPRALPRRVRRGVRHVGLVFNEVRLLHSRDIERSVFEYTLISRALLVCLAPWLGGWTAAPTPLFETGVAGDLAWGGMAVVSVVTAVRTPQVVELAMEDSATGRRLRTRLLRLEVPLAVAGLVLMPTWTVAVFAAGWTNWWQRQTLRLRFSWPKLAGFVAAVVALQQVGLARASVPLPDAAGETALSLLAILVIGASYGAMLPLALATAISVVLGDTRRSLSAARRARDELLVCARDLEAAADSLRPLAASVPAAERAAAGARQAARQLERSADTLGRRGLFVSQVLSELADEATVRSFAPRHGSREHERRVIAAEAMAEPPPAYVGEPIYSPRALQNARLRTQGKARRVRALLEWALNEADRHGTGGIRVLLSLDGDRLVARVANRSRPGVHAVAGLAGEGAAELRRLVKQLPDGRAELRGEAPPSEVGIATGPDWFVVRVSWSAAGLEVPQ